VNFGLVDFTGGHGTALPEVVRNPNSRPLRITGAQAATPYTITADPCLAHAIPPQGSCTITVEFTPASFGANAQVLAVDSAAGSSTTQLSGSGDAILSISVTGPGSATAGKSVCPIQCSVQITAPGTVTLTASANSGYYFHGWGQSCLGAELDSTCQLTVDGDVSVSADFGEG